MSTIFEAQEPVLAYLINSGDINQETAELMWINCRLEMMQVEQALENLEVCISEECPTDKERSSSAKADISKTVNILHPQFLFARPNSSERRQLIQRFGGAAATAVSSPSPPLNDSVVGFWGLALDEEEIMKALFLA
ncbi:Hypothetical predicted protein [Olea europaea subsp. europaea]|uniref:Uncharacterized protein n=1 Tax=Olea europaea subsp. europaea TaxID=158383 RepID=A0A8S0U7C6_OLEEU|nr:Hypothetical predicted protein [Olea europaea subsp. europaea]